MFELVAVPGDHHQENGGCKDKTKGPNQNLIEGDLGRQQRENQYCNQTSNHKDDQPTQTQVETAQPKRQDHEIEQPSQYAFSFNQTDEVNTRQYNNHREDRCELDALCAPDEVNDPQEGHNDNRLAITGVIRPPNEYDC